MAEMSKELKILLIINLVVALIYGILYLFLPEINFALNDAPYFDPHFWRLWGGTCVTLGIVGIIGLLKGEWDHFKLLFLFAIILLFATFIINITTAVYITRSATNLIFHWIDNVVIIVIALIDAIFYWREEKR
jgi:hypothetical protein